jgi:hypothetical protein
MSGCQRVAVSQDNPDQIQSQRTPHANIPRGIFPMVSMNRREFLAASAASLVVTTAGNLTSQGTGASRVASKPWYSTMLRCGHLNFNEQDPITQDVDYWMDYFASLKVQTVMPNGGGIMAFYPTTVPFHQRSMFLGARDLFGEWMTGARKRNFKVIARMDCNYAYEDAFKAHPEWFELNADQSPRRHPEVPALYKTCMFSPYFTEQMAAIYRELNKLYAPDAFYTNGWPSTAALEVCHCQNCQKIYSEQTGGVPPAGTDARSPIYRKYYEVYMNRVMEVWKEWDAVAKENSSHAVYVGNLSGVNTVKDVKRLNEVAAWFYADNQGRQGDAPIWRCAEQGRLAWAVAPGSVATISVGSYASGLVGWRHASKPGPEATLWMAQAVASGMAPSYHWLGGKPADTRWMEAGRSFYQWLAANETHFRNRSTIANLAVLYPQSTISFYGAVGSRERKLNGETIESTDHLEGLYAALLEGRFLFDFVHQENLSAETLKPYRALLIPNAAYLRDSECDAIRAYVAAGGSILATFETSRYNEWGDKRKDFALGDLFGVGSAGEVIGPFGNSYMHIDKPHPVLEGYEGTTMLPGPEFRVQVAAGEDPFHLSVIPNYPAFPPEMVYPRVPHTDEPAGIFRLQGNSRIVYFPGDVDRTYLRSGDPDFSRLIINSVHWLMNGHEQPASVEGKGELELFAWETEAGFALHMLNYTNPRMTQPFMTEIYETGPLKARFTVTGGRKISSVRALRAQRDLHFTQAEGTIQFEVPPVGDYEVIALT